MLITIATIAIITKILQYFGFKKINNSFTIEEQEMEKSWGYHLLLDCYKGDIERITSEKNVQNFVNELVKAIDMVAYGETWINRFATHDLEKAGISFCQMIETSNITGHFCESNGNFYIDIFSCKDFSSDVAQEIVDKYFKPENISYRFIYRDAKALDTTED